MTEWFTFANRCKNQFKILLEISIVQQVQTGNVHLHFWRKLSANHNEAYTNLCPKSQKKHYIFGIIVSTSYWLLQLINKSTAASFYELSICRQARWLSRSPTMLLSFLQTLDHIELYWLWKKIVQRMTIGSQETSLAAWSLFFSQRQDFLNNNWAWIPITANQEGTRDEGHEIKSVSLLITVKKFFEDANRQFVYPPI